ncbi:FKBP-type peptidyl-prolyl cis-trans isomerase [Tamlana sp. I1]|uniref:FKBP-type peptidyl-prolyl cis-trans isomerase n=1 Tax=Tamlana sp. I1 TaxID=2762061 RepID=UPI00188DCD3C|nr:FKBP-type peptidyl-prolyl cis-trans isomerase [Tamlana sp. I1]
MKKILFICAIALFTACEKDELPKDYSAENDAEIQAYITANELEAKKSNSGLYYVIDEEGTGEAPKSTDRVKVIYKGYFTDGRTFDESEDGISINLSQVIRGWTEGMTYFKEGDKGKLLIPAHLAYGSSNHNKIPGGSVLIFDVELVYVNYATENDLEIQDYLAENEITAEKTESGLYYVIDEPGTGAQATEKDNVTVTYKGYFTNDKVFNESTKEVNFDLGNLIKGFTEGVAKLKENGKATLFIPAHLAYGNLGQGTIPPGAVVIFDVTLIKVN